MNLDALIDHTLALRALVRDGFDEVERRYFAMVYRENREVTVSMSLNQFILNFDGKSVWSGCTGNQQAGIRPQCQDLANRWSTNIAHGCFPRIGNAKDIFNNADPAHWKKIKNTNTGVPPAGAVVVFGARPGAPNGHVAIAMSGCTRTTIFTFDQNWSRPNRCARERHDYRYVIGWLRAL